MSTKILPFPVPPCFQDQLRQRHKALSDVRVLVETVYDLLDDPGDEFTQQLLERLLPRVQEALEAGWLK